MGDRVRTGRVRGPGSGSWVRARIGSKVQTPNSKQRIMTEVSGNGGSSTCVAASNDKSACDLHFRLKHELTQTRARIDKKRIEARQLISQRDGLKSDVIKESAELEEQQLILEETVDSIKRLKEHIEVAKGERDMLRKKSSFRSAN